MNKKKLNFLFDASLLTHFFEKEKTVWAGICFCAYNILKELEKQQIFNITLLVSHDRYKFVRKMKKDLFFSRFSYNIIYKTPQLSYRIKLIKTYIKNIKTNFNIIKIIIYLLKILKHFLYAVFYHFNEKYHFNDKGTMIIIKKADVFFSPDSVIYNEILKYTHIRKYMLLHDVMPILFPEYYPTFFLTNDYINEYSNIRYLNKDTYYLCNSECTKRDYVKYYSNLIDEKKMIITYIASSQNFYPDYDRKKLDKVLNKYKVGHSNNDKYIFSLCTLEPRKNLVFTVKCFIKFIKKHKIENLYFYIGGGQWNFFIHKLEEQINNLNEYRDKIVRLGYIDDEDVNTLYSNSLFFTYISQYEGFGMPPLEAMQAGTPVITSNNSSLPEVVGDAAIMIDYDSEEQCIKAFEDLYFNKDLREHHIEKGFERGKLFSWEKTVDKMTKIMIENAT